MKQTSCVRTETSTGEQGEWLCNISHGTESWKMRGGGGGGGYGGWWCNFNKCLNVL